MSADRTDDGEDIKPHPDAPMRAAPGLDRHIEARLPTGLAAEVNAEIAARDRAIGELASENADLYKRIGALEADVKAGHANLRTERERFRTWAKEMGNRDAERAARDEARDKREASLINQVKELRHTVTELERKFSDRPDATDPGASERRLDGQEAVGRQNVKRNSERPWRTNEAIDLYTSGGGALLTIYSDVVGSGAVSEATGLAGSLLTFGAAVIALARKRREGNNADRSED